MDERQLILSCQKGEKEAFNEFIRLYYPYVSKFLFKLTINETLSEDLMQDTFIRLIRGINSYDAGGEANIDAAGTIAALVIIFYWLLLALWVYQNDLISGTDPVLWGGIALVTNIAGLLQM